MYVQKLCDNLEKNKIGFDIKFAIVIYDIEIHFKCNYEISADLLPTYKEEVIDLDTYNIV